MIPATAIGLSDYVKPDLMVGFISVDVALAPSFDRGFGRKGARISRLCTGYKAWTGHSVDYGVAIYINLNGESMLGWRVARIDDMFEKGFPRC
jgi:CRISPR-associated protein Csa1